MIKKDQVRAKIVEVCPDLMDLSFGCRIKLKDSDIIESRIVLSSLGLVHTIDHILDSEDWWQPNKHEYREIKETLGKEITLAHVLRAIYKQNPANKTKITLESDGQFMRKWIDDESVSHVEAKWDLEKSFDDQEEEVFEFLHTIIC